MTIFQTIFDEDMFKVIISSFILVNDNGKNKEREILAGAKNLKVYLGFDMILESKYCVSQIKKDNQ